MKIRPLCPRSQTLLREKMQGDPHVYVLKRERNKVLIVSRKGSYCAWISLKGDRNWELVLAP